MEKKHESKQQAVPDVNIMQTDKLIHPGMVEMITLLIKARDKACDMMESDEEVRPYHKRIIEMIEKLNHHISNMSDVTGAIIQDRLEAENVSINKIIN